MHLIKNVILLAVTIACGYYFWCYMPSITNPFSLHVNQHEQSKDTEKCTANGLDYRGKINKTISNKTCLMWNPFFKLTRPLSGLENNNHCRNLNNNDEGPYCVISYHPLITEVCGIPCDDGYSMWREMRKCTETDPNPLQIHGSLKSCQDRCYNDDSCVIFQFNTNSFPCTKCISSVDTGIPENGWSLWKLYKKPDKCFLDPKDKENPILDFSRCYKHPSIEKDCIILCSKGHVGLVSVRCDKDNGYFQISHTCTYGCYLDPEDAVAHHIQGLDCSNNPNTLTEKCNAECIYPAQGKATTECLEPGGKFKFKGCFLRKCYMNQLKAAQKKVDATLCISDSKHLIPEDECTISCDKGLHGQITAKCSENEGEFDIEGECKETKCYISKKDMRKNILDTTGCSNPLDLYTERNCKVSCSKNYHGSVEVSCLFHKSNFKIIPHCKPNRCVIDESKANDMNINFDNCKDYNTVNECYLRCQSTHFGNPIVLCPIHGGKFEIYGHCEKLVWYKIIKS